MGNYLNIDEVSKKLEARVGDLPNAQVNEYELIGNTNIARVIVTINPNKGSSKNFDALAALFDGNAAPIAHSFRRINGTYETRCTAIGFVAPNRIVEKLDDERKSKMKVISKNILMDTVDQSLWDVKETASEGAFIIRKGEEDLSELLATVCTPRSDIHGMAVVATAFVEPEQYAYWVNPKLQEINCGFVVKANDQTTEVICRQSGDAETIDNRLIVEVVSHLNLGVARKQATAGEAAEDAKEYYAKVFSYDPEYLNEIDKIIDGHAAA